MWEVLAFCIPLSLLIFQPNVHIQQFCLAGDRNISGSQRLLSWQLRLVPGVGSPVCAPFTSQSQREAAEEWRGWIIHVHAMHLQAEQCTRHRMNSPNEEQTSHAGGAGGGGRGGGWRRGRERRENLALHCGSQTPTSATRVGPEIILGWFQGPGTYTVSHSCQAEVLAWDLKYCFLSTVLPIPQKTSQHIHPCLSEMATPGHEHHPGKEA